MSLHYSRYIIQFHLADRTEFEEKRQLVSKAHISTWSRISVPGGQLRIFQNQGIRDQKSRSGFEDLDDLSYWVLVLVFDDIVAPDQRPNSV